MESIKVFFSDNPEYFGVIFIIFGIVMLLSAIYNASWLFKNDVSRATYSTDKIDGWINLFGRKAARYLTMVSSVITIIAGITWFIIYKFYL